MKEKLKYERPIITKINAGVTDKFGMRAKMPVISEIDGIPVKELINKYGSPSFILSEQTIRKTYNDAKRAFTTRYPNVQFAWSYKTNYMNAVCKIFHSEGSWAEVVSGFEYDKAISNGVPGNKIIFNGPDKSKEDLQKATNNGSYIHIDHFDELYDLLSIAETSEKRPKVAIRVNMDTGIFPQWDRFGFNYENGEAWNALNRIMMSKKLDLIGLHTHIGTYMMTPAPYGVAASKLAELAVRLERKFNHKIKYIDMGGGFASKNTLKGAYLPGKDTCPTFDQYAEAISNALINSELDPNEMPTLFLETGRALIDDAGYITGSVLANKRLADGRRSMIIDTGVNMLFTSFWYEHEIYPAKEVSSHSEDTTIYGPLCMNIDVIRSVIKFPLLQKGDHYVIKRIGAYNMTQWMQFITLRPKIILVDPEGKTHIIRENETNESLTSLEVIPEHLK
ncbi:MAG: diaminopimelate decarboxylase [Bacteroidetes bacterium]|nr:MAG: diaminopimelate decarboxylase [Bacteroidota bacterium]